MSRFTFTDPSATHSFEQIPDCLKKYDHWLVVDLTGDRKPPVERLRRRSDFSPTHVASLSSFAEAVRDCRDGEAVAFQFSETPYFGLDWDEVASSADDLTAVLREDFPTYTEWSTSRTGFHSVGRGALLDDYGHRTDLEQIDSDEAHVEVYDSDRYFVFTGEPVEGFPDEVRDCEQSLHDFQRAWLDRKDTQDTPAPKRDVSGDVESVYRTVQEYAKTDHALSGKAQKTLDYWHQSVGTRGNGKSPDESEVDASFVNLLYFWSKGDTGLVEECWRASDRFDKKARRSDYREDTIVFASSNRRTDTFQSRWVQ